MAKVFGGLGGNGGAQGLETGKGGPRRGRVPGGGRAKIGGKKVGGTITPNRGFRGSERGASPFAFLRLPPAGEGGSGQGGFPIGPHGGARDGKAVRLGGFRQGFCRPRGGERAGRCHGEIPAFLRE